MGPGKHGAADTVRLPAVFRRTTMAQTRTVGDLMTPNPTYCTPDANLTEIAQLMVCEDTGIIPVVEDRSTLRLAGVVTDRDIVVRAVAKELDPATTTVQEI